MYSPTTRLLTVLELLQSKGSATGPELAERLEVDVRSVRRYITMLRDMGIPVESEPGRYGSYYLRPGFRLPPLMFNHSEITAIFLGLMAVRRMGLTAATGMESAAAKIERVLPDELRDRIRAIQGVLTLNISANPGTPDELVAVFSLAAYQHNQLWIEYRAGRDEKPERAVDVYGLVYHAGFWYAAGYCHLRRNLRVFRLDRVLSARLLDAGFDPPQDFDALAFLIDSIARMPGTWQIEVLLRTTLEEAHMLIPDDMAVLESTAEGVWMRCYSDRLDWIARFLAGLRCPMKITKPPELREEMRRLAEAIRALADA